VIVEHPIQLRVAETTLRGARDIAGLQSGLLSCVWGGESKTDNSWDQTIVLSVLPHAAADYDAGVMQVDDGAVVYTVGDLSEYLCQGADEYQSRCTANLLTDGYWVQLAVNSGGSNDGRTLGSAEAGMRTLLDSLFAAVSGASAQRPDWVAPGVGSGGAFCTDPASTGTVQGAFSNPALAPRDYTSPPPYGAATVAQQRAGLAACGWSDGAGAGVDVTVVPGGGWAFPALLASPPQVSYDLPPLEAASVPGTDSALAVCGESGYCYAIVSVGGSAVAVSGPDIGIDAFVNAVATVATAVAAS
jgi:hypothetical protein